MHICFAPASARLNVAAINADFEPSSQPSHSPSPSRLLPTALFQTPPQAPQQQQPLLRRNVVADAQVAGYQNAVSTWGGGEEADPLISGHMQSGGNGTQFGSNIGGGFVQAGGLNNAVSTGGGGEEAIPLSSGQCSQLGIWVSSVRMQVAAMTVLEPRLMLGSLGEVMKRQVPSQVIRGLQVTDISLSRMQVAIFFASLLHS